MILSAKDVKYLLVPLRVLGGLLHKPLSFQLAATAEIDAEVPVRGLSTTPDGPGAPLNTEWILPNASHPCSDGGFGVLVGVRQKSDVVG